MTRLRILLSLVILSACTLLPCGARAQSEAEESEWIIESLRGEQGEAIYDFDTGIVTITNGVRIRYAGAVLTAERAALKRLTGDVIADGQVRIQQGDQIWTSEHIRFNFKTGEMEAQQFRTGVTPVFAAGADLQGDMTNKVYEARDAMLTTDDVAKPAIKVRAKHIKIIPGKRIEATHATLYYGNVPVFYFPYYTRNIGPNANNFNATPGYRKSFGPFILGTYTWYLNEHLDGIFHLDYRWERGPGVGPDLNYHFGPWGKGTFRYYYTHDKDPNASNLDPSIPENRQRVYFTYDANPATNLYLKSLVQYESDLAVVRDFFEGEYRRNPQPNTFFEANKFWQNFSLDTLVQPRLNDFLETVERLPDVRLSGFPQQLGPTPLFYQTESSLGYYRRRFADEPEPSPIPDYEAARADTYHQVTLPKTFFGWLNVTPRAGGRLTWYGEAHGPGGLTEEETRGVFNTGAEVSFKASRLWPAVQSKTLEMNGLRHIVQPSANYVYVPEPNVRPPDLPQFDYELPSLRLLPIEYPDYNDIDSIDSQNVIRWGLRNKLQTKRQDKVVNLLYWDLYTDWRLDPRSDQTTFADLYSDLALRPRSWLTLECITRYDLESGNWRMAYNTLTIEPNQIWSWRIGYYYLADDFRPPPEGLGQGNDVLSSTIHYRLNENWGFRMSHYFDADAGRLREQTYTVYRDLRSWTAALSFMYRQGNATQPDDYGVAFTFSLKAYPQYKLGTEAGGPHSLLGL